jgi:hypothetical protein
MKVNHRHGRSKLTISSQTEPTTTRRSHGKQLLGWCGTTGFC